MPRPDPYLTHTSKIPGSAGLLAWRSLFLSQSYCRSFSDGLGDEPSHPVGGFSPHIPSDVGVGVQSEARAVVAQDAGDRFGVHALLDCQGGVGASEPVEGDVFSDSGLFQQGLVQPSDTVRAVELTRHWGGEHDGVAGMFAVLLEQ